jgi:hypothetical protein
LILAHTEFFSRNPPSKRLNSPESWVTVLRSETIALRHYLREAHMIRTRSIALALMVGIIFVIAGLVIVTSTSRAEDATCKSGYVWRVARPSDLVCVTPESRSRVAEENRVASSRIQPGGGASGPFTCLPGFVWREAFEGDIVCVTPEVRTLVREENRVAASRRVGD